MSGQLDFKDLVVVVTGAGNGIGRVYARFFAARGSKVVVNDVSAQAAQAVVDELVKAGGQAAPAVGSVAEGDKIIDQAVKAFGTVHVLINNAGILRDKSFKNMSDQDWDLVTLVHLKGAYSCTKACWPLFRQQKFGRVINTASAAGLYGNMGQANYSAAKMGLVGFTRTLAREGVKYNIKTNVIVPMAASAMTETILPPDMLKGLKPEFIAPFVGVLTAKNGPDVSGRIFELGAGFFSEVRWERSSGAVFKTGDDTFTPSAVAAKWSEVQDFSKPEHPMNSEDGDMVGLLQKSKKSPPNPQSSPAIDFKGKTVVITGAGAGLGRSYALMFGKLGANVVINDVSKDGADKVVEEVKALGAKAVSAVCSAEEGETVVKAALDAFGTVHILVANAGILRDKAFVNMDEKMWDQVIAVHLRGTYRCAKAVWPVFQKQKFGRIITTASPNGIYGTVGQANYSTAKAAIIGFTRTLAIEGSRANIKVNCIAPRAGTAMTATVWPKEMVEAMRPEYIAPIVGYLASDSVEDSGTFYETFGGYCAQMRWQRTYGVSFPNDRELKPESIVGKWKEITTFDDRATNPSSGPEALQQIMANFSNIAAESSEESSSGGANYEDSEDTEEIKAAKRNAPEPEEFTYTERDVMLYNLGIGAKASELQWVYENSDGFAALPTFGVIPQFGSSSSMSMDFVPNFNPAKLLHGEQYLKIKAAVPTSGTVVNHVKLLEVLDKGKAASVTVIVDTRDKASGESIWESQSTVVLRGSGGFGGKKSGSDRGPATALNQPPKRQPDAVIEEKTTPEQAALYRLSGDYNPLHIDPQFASMGGFPKPILHGLCFMGIAGKHVLKSFGPYEDIKVRFAGTVIPGETLVTEMWKEGNKVIFTTKVKERDAPALSNAAVTLVGGGNVKAKL
ncbi:peroxisomal hydratase-dehydrogenase-epimerase [Naematelia encephala]|uniref:Peroxisomal hydratase-dehydrogenase-epimerase n=1 Tax=Naematelia encephala TaxID=71784 RepID=A0A1Y2AJB5_9TREE|nr:peroxisomal hydratase-dehydrogenase-epimerase [Naematelia encephala]